MLGRLRPLVAAGVCFCFVYVRVSPVAAETSTDGATPLAAIETRLATAYGKLPLSFEVNQGQTDPAVRFLARGVGYRMFLTSDSAVIVLNEPPPPNSSQNKRGAARRAALRIRFLGANASAKVSAEAPLEGRSHYFVSDDPARHITNVAHFAQVRYSELYPDIDLVYYGNQRQLEYDLVLAPGADASRITLAFEGADEIVLDTEGNLILRTPLGDIKQHRPNIYQDVGGKRKPIDGRYVQLGENTVGVRVAAYDLSKPLIIDPALSYSTFLGGGKGYDTGTAIAVDSAGNAYVAGLTYSSDFPLVNPYDSSLGHADEDVFVTKLNAAGNALIYSTYLGGPKNLDYATGIAIDAAGSVYITGSTNGTGFPTSTDAYQRAAVGGGSFVAKLSPAGNTLAYSTYLLNVSQTRIAVDSLGNAYIAGQASTGLVTTPDAFQSTMRSASGTAPFVLKLNPTGSGAVYSTFIGSSGTDSFKGLALDSNENAYIAGSTTSSDFPVVNALQSVPQGALDGFVTKLNATGTGLVYSTYLGGGLDDSINAIAVDQDGTVYLAGETYSSNFPLKSAFQPVKAGQLLTNSSLGNAFVTKLSPSGDSLVYSSFLGGEVCTGPCYSIFGVPQIPGDAAYGIAADNQGHAYVTGLVKSYTFPLVNSPRGEKQQDNQDSLFITKVSRAGTAMLYSAILYTGYSNSGTTVTGAPPDAGQAITVDGSGNAYLTYGGPSDFTTTPGAFQTASAGGDAVIFKLSSGAVSLSFNSSDNPANVGQPLSLTATVIGANPNSSVTFLEGRSSIGSATVNNGVATITITPSAGIHTLTAVYRDGNNEADAPPIVQIVNPSAVCN